MLEYNIITLFRNINLLLVVLRQIKQVPNGTVLGCFNTQHRLCRHHYLQGPPLAHWMQLQYCAIWHMLIHENSTFRAKARRLTN